MSNEQSTRKLAPTLRIGDRIHAEGVNWLHVDDIRAEPGDDVEVDVVPPSGAEIWDGSVLAAAAGAHAARWMSGLPVARWRLFYGPSVEVQVAR